jgi:hypothetical protein
MSGSGSLVPAALGLYAVWVLATYLLEGRVELLSRPDPAGRAVYALIANVLVGTLGAAWLVRQTVRRGVLTLDRSGFRPVLRAGSAAVVGLVLGLILFLAQGPRTLEPLVVLNAYAQVLPTSIAEILVCWVAVGALAEAAMTRRGRVLAAVVGALAASVLFGVYHFAHSAPFNQLPVVIFLTLIGLVTILFHNFLGITGVLNAAQLEVFRQPLYPVYALAAIAMAALIGCHVWLARARIER